MTPEERQKYKDHFLRNLNSYEHGFISMEEAYNKHVDMLARILGKNIADIEVVDPK